MCIWTFNHMVCFEGPRPDGSQDICKKIKYCKFSFAHKFNISWHIPLIFFAVKDLLYDKEHLLIIFWFTLFGLPIFHFFYFCLFNWKKKSVKFNMHKIQKFLCTCYCIFSPLSNGIFTFAIGPKVRKLCEIL